MAHLMRYHREQRCHTKCCARRWFVRCERDLSRPIPGVERVCNPSARSRTQQRPGMRRAQQTHQIKIQGFSHTDLTPDKLAKLEFQPPTGLAAPASLPSRSGTPRYKVHEAQKRHRSPHNVRTPLRTLRHNSATEARRSKAEITI